MPRGLLGPALAAPTADQRQRGRRIADQVGYELACYGMPAERHYPLSDRIRPTFFLAASGVVIEVASKTTPATVAYRRLQRYATHEDVRALLLVAPALGDLARTLEIGGKPAFFVQIGAAR